MDFVFKVLTSESIPTLVCRFATINLGCSIAGKILLRQRARLDALDRLRRCYARHRCGDGRVVGVFFQGVGELLLVCGALISSVANVCKIV
jgi:hypothetical protein